MTKNNTVTLVFVDPKEYRTLQFAERLEDNDLSDPAFVDSIRNCTDKGSACHYDKNGDAFLFMFYSNKEKQNNLPN